MSSAICPKCGAVVSSQRGEFGCPICGFGVEKKTSTYYTGEVPKKEAGEKEEVKEEKPEKE